MTLKRQITRKRVPLPKKSRSDMISEAVIAILAKSGARGLSHRKIDKYLGFPEGSTSAYFRHRSDLFRAGYAKMVELNVTDMAKSIAPILIPSPDGSRLDIDLAADRHFEIWKMFAGKNKYRIVAHVEFLLEGMRDAELRKREEEIARHLYEQGEKLFTAMGANNPSMASARYCTLMQAEAWTYVLAPTLNRGYDVTPAYFAEKFRQIIEDTNAIRASSG